MTYYYEGQIVRELQTRKPATKDEQLKIDYCHATYSNELDNMSFIFSCPVETDTEKIYPDRTKEYSLDELAELINCYSHYTDIVEREILIEYVDYALNMLEREDGSQRSFKLLSALADLDQREIIRVPEWINIKLNQLN